jgi:hypothetical protein
LDMAVYPGENGPRDRHPLARQRPVMDSPPRSWA